MNSSRKPTSDNLERSLPSLPRVYAWGREGDFRRVIHTWSEATAEVVGGWMVERPFDLECQVLKEARDHLVRCAAPVCAVVPWHEGQTSVAKLFDERAPDAFGLIIDQHLHLHSSMGERGENADCIEHRDPSDHALTLCATHERSIRNLLADLELIRGAELDNLWRRLNEAAKTIEWAGIAAQAATASERQRARMEKKPRRGKAPAGWGLGRRILDRVGLPVHYLPARRDEWPAAGDKFVLLNGERVSRTDRLLAAGDRANERRARIRAAHVPGRPLPPEVEQEAAALGIYWEPMSAPCPGWPFGIGRLVIPPPETSEYDFPRSSLSHFWTCLIRELTTVYAPRLRTPRRSRSSSTGNKGSRHETATRLVRLTLATLAPGEHLDTGRAEVWKRSRNS